MKILLILVLLSACSSQPVIDGAVVPYQTSGIEQFLLPELPSWCNGNLSASCVRNFSGRFVNHEALEKTYGLELIQRVELQAHLNRKIRTKYGDKSITPREEAVLFLETLEQIRGGLREYRFPDRGNIHLVWWDQLKDKASAKLWLQQLARSGDAIVLVSLCRDTLELEQWLERQGLPDLGVMSFGFEYLGTVRSSGAQTPGLFMPLDVFFPPERATLWVINQSPVEFPVGYNIRLIEE